MTIEVEFKMTKTAGARAAVTLGDNTPGSTLLVFDAAGKATAKLKSGTAYLAVWAMIGAKGDTIKVTWKANGIEGTLIEGSIRKDKAVLQPGGKWRDEDVGYYPGVAEA